MLRRAKRSDMPPVAEIYRKAFRDSVEDIFGGKASGQTFIDIYRFLLDEFPDHFLVAERDGKIVGYAVVPPDTSRLVTDAVVHGHVFVWVWHWLTGRYGFGLRAVWTLVADKFALLSNTNHAAESSDARILSVAVDPEWQGTGIGTELSEAGLELLQKAGTAKVMLEVRDYNEPAIHIYRKLGFHEVGRFSDNRGCWIQMIRHLKPAKRAA